MFSLLFTELILPVAVTAVKSYINSSETKKDDKVLEIVQKGAIYLSEQPNNTVSQNLAYTINSEVMRPIQNSKE